MGYQALLFCPDEKLARIATQVFSELDFSVDLVNEPFAAVKKLMAQRYDALVVDCEDEQNATLLFKSARNSVSNQNSLALALVEGQAGVAKAYRIGANLVLTKPINVEQAKGTLRVARGLLRKHSDAASASTSASASSSPPVKAAPAPTASPATPGSPVAEPVAPTKSKYELPEFESPLPAMAAAAKVADHPMDAAAPEARTKVSAEADATPQAQRHSSTPAFGKAAAAPVPPAAPKGPVASLGSAHGAAAAPAPAKETPDHKEKKHFESASHAEAGSSALSSTSAVSAPSFAAFREQDSGGSGGKKILVVAAVILVVAGLGYVGWTKLGKRSAVSQSVTAPQKPVTVSSPAPTPPSPVPPAGSIAGPAASTTWSAAAPAGDPQLAKPAAGASSSPTIKIAANTEPGTKKAEPPPIVVKSTPTARKIQPQAEEAAPLAPNPLAVASSGDKNLSGLLPSEPASLPKAALTTLKISQGVSQGLLIKRVQPKYPPNALAMRIQGSVQMEATINKEGSITNLKLLNGDPVLARAAMEAVRQWRYKPYYLDSEPVEIQTQITVIFKLPG